jgi:hypothetical protein
MYTRSRRILISDERYDVALLIFRSVVGQGRDNPDRMASLGTEDISPADQILVFSIKCVFCSIRLCYDGRQVGTVHPEALEGAGSSEI